MSDDGFVLTPNELETLSGYRRGKEQCAWLRANGIPYVLNRWSKPQVLRSAIEDRMREKADDDESPNFRALRKAS